jgi:uncharacterized protein (DUF305 family)
VSDDPDQAADVSVRDLDLDDNETAEATADETGDDTIVLPWWQHPINIITIAVTVGLIAGMIGWMVGDSNSELAHNEVDTGFLQDMREHHDQAVYMAFVYRALPNIDAGLGTVAGSAIIGQSQETGRMVQMLRLFGETEANEGDTSMAWMGMSTERGNMPGMATEEQLDRLATLSGAEADEFFVQLMTDHHQGGIHMADYAAEHAENDEVRRMAASMARSQADEIAEMQRELAN